jgi:hypothetical protein
VSLLIISAAAVALLAASATAKVVRGSNRADVLWGTMGADVIRGLAGDDRLIGGAGPDRIEGGYGKDTLVGGPGPDVLLGGAGNDRLQSRDGHPDTVWCGGGRDMVTADRRDAVARECEQVKLPRPPQSPNPGKTVELVDQSWNCRGPVDLDLVRVTMRTAVDDAIHLRPGCSGRIRRVEIETWTADGIKINSERPPSPSDIVIESGYVRCYQRAGDVHQDGVQVMGGERITFKRLEVNCTTAGNAQFFVQAAAGGMPVDVVCERCLLGPGASTTLRIERSLRSGARETLVCRGRHFGIHVTPAAQVPLNFRNRLLAQNDRRCKGA